MPLHCGIIGLANSGKSTLFNCVSNTKALTSPYAYTSNKSNIGVAKVPDPRLHEINNFVKAAKIVPTTIELVDIPGSPEAQVMAKVLGNSFLSDIRNADALIHIACFDDPNLPTLMASG